MKKNKNLEIEKLIRIFLEEVEKNNIYNEFSFQHELGFFLRNKINEVDKNYKVEFERNIKFFDITEETPKKEIDIVIYKEPIDRNKKYAIELKFHPQKCNVPQRMFDSIVDIKFMEVLKNNGFETYTCSISNENRLYETRTKRDRKKYNIYKFFREGKMIHGKISNEINYKYKNKEFVSIKGNYVIIWKLLKLKEKNKISNKKYYILKMNN